MSPQAAVRRTSFRDEHVAEPSPGHRFRVRPVRASDDAGLRQLFEEMSPADARFRFLASVRTFSDRVVQPLTHLANLQRLGLVAAEEGRPDRIVAHAILAPDPDGAGGEFGLLVRADCRHTGLGRHLLECLAGHARALGLRELYGTVLRDNQPMRTLAREMGFAEKSDPLEPGCVRVALAIAGAPRAAG